MVDRFGFYFETNSRYRTSHNNGILFGRMLSSVLLGEKKKRTYARMINELKKVALPIKLEFRPIEIMIGFEKGAIEAFSE